MGVGGQRHAPAVLYPQEIPGTHCVVGWVGPRAVLDGCGKILPPPGLDPRTVHPVASRYTDCAIPGSSNLKDNIQLHTEFPSVEFCLEADLSEGERLKLKANRREMGRWVSET